MEQRLSKQRPRNSWYTAGQTLQAVRTAGSVCYVSTISVYAATQRVRVGFRLSDYRLDNGAERLFRLEVERGQPGGVLEFPHRD